LVVAGFLAFVAYAVLGSWLLFDDPDFEITIFTVGFQASAYLFMMVFANFCFLLGPFSERFVRPLDLSHYRHTCFRLGFWFSVLLPFSVPVLVVVSALFGSHHGSDQP
jgi:MFS family permease